MNRTQKTKILCGLILIAITAFGCGYIEGLRQRAESAAFWVEVSGI